ncbi:MAG TPA: hypothetical protein VKA07_11060 [Candidatus Sulfotelmatobacter sp.]|nr:hypothetical protein [Candidatus Sulfotelmatobacter sp.]
MIFVLCCLLSSARMVLDTPLPRQGKADEIARLSDRRFAALRAELPQRGVVGYVGESGSLAVADYYLAQYALTPLVVEHSANHRMVVGNFPSAAGEVPGQDLQLAQELQLVKDFGNGVLLFANPRFADIPATDKDAR